MADINVLVANMMGICSAMNSGASENKRTLTSRMRIPAFIKTASSSNLSTTSATGSSSYEESEAGSVDFDKIQGDDAPPSSESSTADKAVTTKTSLQQEREEEKEERIRTYKRLIRETWKMISGDGCLQDEAVRIFYQHLFAKDASIEALFAGTNMDVQAKKLFKTLDLTVRHVEHLQHLVSFLQVLGVNHARSYGVKPRHYDAVGEALLWTLHAGLGDTVFTEQVRAAWTWAYTLISKTMEDAAVAAEQKLVMEQQQRDQRMDFSGYKGPHNKSNYSSIGTVSRIKAELSQDTDITKQTVSYACRCEYTRIIKETWKLVDRDPNAAIDAAVVFYDRLFQSHPEMELLFSHLVTNDAHTEEFYKTLNLIVKYMEPDKLVLYPLLKTMGVHHAQQYGVSRRHYCAARESFLAMVQTCLERGNSNSTIAAESEVSEAWGWAYDLLTTTMADAADAAASTCRR